MNSNLLFYKLASGSIINLNSIISIDPIISKNEIIEYYEISLQNKTYRIQKNEYIELMKTIRSYF